ILSDDQNKQVKNTRGGFAGGGPGGPPGPMAFPAGGRGGPDSPPRPGQILASFVQDSLKLTKEQKQQLEEDQKEVNDKLDKLLTGEQKKQIKQPQGGAGGSADFAPPGQLMALTVQIRLKLTADQRKQLQELQKETDGKLDKLLGNDQKKQFKEMRAN